MQAIFTLGALVCLGGGAWVVWLFIDRLILPVVGAKMARFQHRQQLQSKLDEVIFKQQLTTSQQAWDDLQVHRERLERSLDDMHNNTGEHS